MAAIFRPPVALGQGRTASQERVQGPSGDFFGDPPGYGLKLITAWELRRFVLRCWLIAPAKPPGLLYAVIPVEDRHTAQAAARPRTGARASLIRLRPGA